MTGANKDEDAKGRDEAADWLARVTRADATPDDWSALEVWLASSADNRVAFASAQALWSELDRFAPELSKHVARPPRPRVSFRASWTVAAGLATTLVLALIVTVYVLPGRTAHFDDYATTKGQAQTISLNDGSKIYLNTNSHVAVRMDPHLRRIRMSDGEAAFDVAKDSSRPFVITAGDSEIRVVGTEFNVLHHVGKLVVTVDRGVVLVKSSLDNAPVHLTVGDRLVHQDGTNLAEVARVNPRAALAWRSGQLIYESASLENVIEDLNRYFAVPIVVDDNAQNITFSGVLIVDSEDSVLKRLQALLPIVVSQRGDRFTLHSISSQH